MTNERSAVSLREATLAQRFALSYISVVFVWPYVEFLIVEQLSGGLLPHLEAWVLLRQAPPIVGSLIIVLRTDLRAALGFSSAVPFRGISFTAVLTVMSLVWFALAASGAWPWLWQNPQNASVQFFIAAARESLWIVFALHLVVASVCVPLAEEYAMRLGVLTFFSQRAGGPFSGVLFSSVVFGSLHLHAEFEARDFIGLIALGFVAGLLTLLDGGRVRLAVAVHASRNAMEALLLILGAINAQRT